MNTSHPLTIILPAVALLLTAVLKVASRAVGRRELHRWARRTLGDDADEGSSWNISVRPSLPYDSLASFHLSLWS